MPDEEIDAICKGARLPVIAGSGITIANAGHILARLDGAIVGSSLKLDGVWWNPVEQARVERLVEVVRPLRQADRPIRKRPVMRPWSYRCWSSWRDFASIPKRSFSCLQRPGQVADVTRQIGDVVLEPNRTAGLVQGFHPSFGCPIEVRLESCPIVVG